MSRLKNALLFAAWFFLAYLLEPILRHWVNSPDCPYREGCPEDWLPRFLLAAAVTWIAVVVSVLLSWYAKRTEKPMASAAGGRRSPRGE
jgi:hypothetical protein